MKKRIKKIKFKGGSDATQMMVRKLLNNFIVEGKITTTQKRVKVMKPLVEIIINKAKRNSESDRNFMFRKLDNKKSISMIVEQIAPIFKDRVGGYVRVVRLQNRATDDAKIARLEWTLPVVMEKESKEKKMVEKPQVETKKKSKSRK